MSGRLSEAETTAMSAYIFGDAQQALREGKLEHFYQDRLDELLRDVREAPKDQADAVAQKSLDIGSMVISATWALGIMTALAERHARDE